MFCYSDSWIVIEFAKILSESLTLPQEQKKNDLKDFFDVDSTNALIHRPS